MFNVTATGQGTITVEFDYNGIAVGASSTCSSANLQPQTRPYFKVTNGDINAGGSFANAAGVCPPVPAAYKNGGIRAYAKQNTKQGASVDFAAYALGEINGSFDGPNGFYNVFDSGASNKPLFFSNDTSDGSLGGNLNNGQPQSHCLPDYYNVTRTGSIQSAVPNAASASGQYQVSGALNWAGVRNLPDGKKKKRYGGGYIYIN